MDEPARKRRKTASPDPRERESSPLKKPPRRPSFASPTKASLARNYPNLVQRPTSSGSAAARPTSRSGLLARGKQGRSFAPGEEDEEEPELPSTPSQTQLAEKDTPRRGILFSSPSKRPPRIKHPIKQTPLKSKAPAVQEVEAETPEEEENAEDELSQDIGQKKKISPPDPELEKRKQEKVRLQHEIEKLEAQVSRCAEEIAKDQESQVLTSQERDDLVQFISMITNADIEEEHSPSVSNLLCSFLPFLTRIAPPPKTTREEPIPSHQPIELDNPLPYLEMFTTFKYTTRLSLPRKKFNPASSRVVQKHTVDIAGPQKLLSASLSVTIDAEANKILDLQILRLSSWAERELGKFTRERAQEKDLGNVCWAIGSYWEIARKRAEYWHKCEQTFAQLIPGHSNEDIENLQNSLKIKPSVSNINRKDLNRHLGRDLFVLQDKHVLLKLVWHIDFDWTGEAGSSIHVEPAFPQVCKCKSNLAPINCKNLMIDKGPRQILRTASLKSRQLSVPYYKVEVLLKQHERSWLYCFQEAELSFTYRGKVQK